MGLIEFEDSLDVLSPVYYECKAKDTNAIIVLIRSSSYWFEGLHKDYIVFNPNGSIKRVERFIPTNDSKRIKSKSTRIKGNLNQDYWHFLDTCILSGLFDINQDNLNLTSRPSQTKGRSEELVVHDGVSYSFAVFYGKRFLNYSTYAPEEYISRQYPGLESREKFLSVIQGFNKLKKPVGNNG